MVGSVQVLSLLGSHGPHPLLSVHAPPLRKTDRTNAGKEMGVGGLEERLDSGISRLFSGSRSSSGGFCCWSMKASMPQASDI